MVIDPDRQRFRIDAEALPPHFELAAFVGEPFLQRSSLLNPEIGAEALHRHVPVGKAADEAPYGFHHFHAASRGSSADAL
jgi:hypothetical protein